MNFQKSLKIQFFFLLVCGLGIITAFGQQTGNVRGVVIDQFGAVLIGVDVRLKNDSETFRKTITNQTGNFLFNKLEPGNYQLIIQTKGFKEYEKDLTVENGNTLRLEVKMEVFLDEDITVNVDPNKTLGVDSGSGISQIIIKDEELAVLPDDPQALIAALQSLTGGGGSLDGGAQIYVDGLAGNVPPKSSILEVRINQNQLNAEFDRAGFGRIDIITKPGSEQLTGGAYFNISDDALVSRNPFVPILEPYQTRLYGGNVSGAIIPNKFSYFVDFQRREEDTNKIVNSRILNEVFEPVVFSTAASTPVRFTTLTPRLDYKINDNNYLTFRYAYTRNKSLNNGVGDFSLPERGYPVTNQQHLVQVRETSALNTNTSLEFRFQFLSEDIKRADENRNPEIFVTDAFKGGGPGVGNSSYSTRRWEVQNYLTSIIDDHTLRYGVRLRGVSIRENFLYNSNGTFVFAGKTAPVLDSQNQIVFDTSGEPILTQISSLESYRRTLLLQSLGFSPDEIRLRGGGASQFIINTGDPVTELTQVDFGAFFQDEWRLRPNLSVGFGLRYENQTNISSHLNFAPRLFFAWAPGNKQQPDFVIRGGFGVFYDRSGEQPILLSRKYNGTNQIRYYIKDPAILDLFPNVPTASELDQFADRRTVSIVDEDLRAPYSRTFIINLEKKLPYGIQGYMYAYTYRTYGGIRQRNINAPLPGTFVPPTNGNPGDPGIRPNPDLAEIFFYESSGNFSINQATFGVRKFYRNGNSFFLNYILGQVKSDYEDFPANSYDLTGEYSVASFDVRHRFFLGGNYVVPKIKVSLSPFVIATSGKPFNITTGIDNNGDGVFTDRPAFATPQTLPENLRVTRFGNFDINPLPGQALIQRNLVRGPAFFSVNLNVNRTFNLNFGKNKTTGGTANQQTASERNYKLTLTMQIQNLFNRTNLDVANGNLSSPLFGQSVRTVPSYGFGTPAGFNRRIEFGARFNF